MAADPTFIVEPIVIGNSVMVALLLLLGLRLTRPSDPAALDRHQRVTLFAAVTFVVWFAVDYGLARAGVFGPNAAGGQQSLPLVPNIAGIGDLVVAVATGFVSAPGRYQMLAYDAPNALIGAYPLVMIPLFAVPLSILLHVVSLRRFFAGKPIGQVSVS